MAKRHTLYDLMRGLFGSLNKGDVENAKKVAFLLSVQLGFPEEYNRGKRMEAEVIRLEEEARRFGRGEK